MPKIELADTELHYERAGAGEVETGLEVGRRDAGLPPRLAERLSFGR